jgi:lysophospholipase L1-like esterase
VKISDFRPRLADASGDLDRRSLSMAITGDRAKRIMFIGVPWGGGGVARELAARFAARQSREAGTAPEPTIDDSQPFSPIEQLEPRLLLSANNIAFIGSSTVEGITGTNSFRRPLWQQLNSAGYDVNFVGSKNTNGSGSTPPNNDFDRDNDGRGGWRADHFLTGNNGIPKLADLLKGKSADGVDFTPDIAVIYVGHNDIFQNQSASSTRDEISQIIDVLRADNPNVQIVLGLLHNTDWTSPRIQVTNEVANARIAELNSMLVTLAQQKSTNASPIVIADINSGFNPTTMTSDGQHANPEGEAWMAQRFFQAINALPGRVIVEPLGGLSTTESGGKAFFSVRLSKAPTANVTINISSSDTTEGTVNKTSITFTPQNWNVSQTVAVTGVDDNVRDGDKAYSIILSNTQSSDPKFSGVNSPNVSMVNLDNDGAITGTVFLDTNKNGSQNSGEPNMANVLVFLDLNNNGLVNNGEPFRTTGSDGKFTFDHLGPGTYTLRVVAPEGYTISPNGSATHTFTVGGGQVSTGNFGLVVIPGEVILTPTSNMQTTEAGGTATFTVRLSKAPTANVTVNLASSNTGEGTINTTTLTFTPQNWNQPQTVVITGVDDNVLDGHKAFKINVTAITSNDPAYQGIPKPGIDVTNRDNEASLSGTVFFDINANGQRDGGENGLNGVTVFLDTNGNGKLDPGELSTTTNSQGQFNFGVVPAGNYNVRVNSPTGYIAPVGNGFAIPTPGGETTTRDFALVKPVDTAGNTIDTARNLGTLAAPAQVVSEYLTSEDRVDMYRLRVKKNGKLRVVLNGMNSDVRVQLFDKNGKRIRKRDLIRQANRRIDAQGLRGVIFIRVVSFDGIDTPYRLRIVNR